jgi:hypothetical protein
LLGGLLRGLIIGFPLLGQELIGFLSLENEKLIFPIYFRKRLHRLCSNPFLILLDCGGIHWGKRSFKFENMWIKLEGSVDRVR